MLDLEHELMWLARLAPRNLFEFYDRVGSYPWKRSYLHTTCATLVNLGFLVAHEDFGRGWYALTQRGQEYRERIAIHYQLDPHTHRIQKILRSKP